MDRIEKAIILLKQLKAHQKFQEVITYCNEYLKLIFDIGIRNKIKIIKAHALRKLGKSKAAKTILYQLISSGNMLEYCKLNIVKCIIQDYVKNFYLNLVEELRQNNNNCDKDNLIKKILKINPEELNFIYEEYMLSQCLAKHEANLSSLLIKSILALFPKTSKQLKYYFSLRRTKNFQKTLDILDFIESFQTINKLRVQNQRFLTQLVISAKLIYHIVLKNMKEILSIYEKFFKEENSKKDNKNPLDVLKRGLDHSSCLIKQGNFDNAKSFLINYIPQIFNGNKAIDNTANISNISPEILAETYIQSFVCYFNLKDEYKSTQIISQLPLLFPKNNFAGRFKDMFKSNPGLNQVLENSSKCSSTHSCQPESSDQSVFINGIFIEKDVENSTSKSGKLINLAS